MAERLEVAQQQRARTSRDATDVGYGVMDMRQGAVWAYRLILNREPESDEVAERLARQADSPLMLRRFLRRSAEFRSLLERAGLEFRSTSALRLEEGVAWAYRLFLDRDPDERERMDCLATVRSINDLRLRVLLTAERERGAPGLDPLADFSIINAFAPFPDRPGVDGAFRDFLGNITRTAYVGGAWNSLSGYVYRSVPRDAEAGLHGTAEWVGTLRSVLEAGGTLTVAELGAGWAPWLVVAHRAARLLGIDAVRLTALEGSSEHFDFIADNFAANGLVAGDHTILHAVAAASDGVAMFPKLHSSEDYGANAVFMDGERVAAASRGDLEEIKALSLRSVVGGQGRVDLVHIDIQGHELEVIRAGMESLNECVRRLVIGTHSRAIEGLLIELLEENGWICEFEVPCKLVRSSSGKFSMVADGEQVWRNDRLAILNPLFA